MHDTHSNVKVVEALPVAAYDADNTPAAVDHRGYGSAELVVAVGADGVTFSATDKIELKLTHSDNDSDYTAVTVDDMLGLASVGTGGIIKSLIAAHATAAVYRYGYRGGKRYTKLLADFSGTHGTPTPLAAVWVLGHGHVSPQANQA